MKTLYEGILDNMEEVLAAGDHRFLEQLRSYLLDKTSCEVAYKIRIQVNKPITYTSQPGWNAFVEMARKNLYTVDIKSIESKDKIKPMSSYVIVRHPYREDNNTNVISRITFVTKDRRNCKMYDITMVSNKPTLVKINDNLINTELNVIRALDINKRSTFEIFELSTNTSWHLLTAYLNM